MWRWGPPGHVSPQSTEVGGMRPSLDPSSGGVGWPSSLALTLNEVERGVQGEWVSMECSSCGADLQSDASFC